MESKVQSYRTAKRMELADRRLKVAKMYLEDKLTIPEIAETLDVGIATVSEDMHYLLADWKRQAHLEVEAHIARQLQKIEALERMARDAYERSCKPKKVANASKSSGTTSGIQGSSAYESKSSNATLIERDEGDPRYLVIMQNCIRDTIKLLRLDEFSDEDVEKSRPMNTFADWVAAEIAKSRREKSVTNSNRLPRAPVPVGNLP